MNNKDFEDGCHYWATYYDFSVIVIFRYGKFYPAGRYAGELEEKSLRVMHKIDMPNNLKHNLPMY